MLSLASCWVLFDELVINIITFQFVLTSFVIDERKSI
jgi:hypothetical protein